MKTIDLAVGTHCLYQGKEICLRRVIDMQTMLGQYEATGALVVVPIKDLHPLTGGAVDAHDVFLHV